MSATQWLVTALVVWMGIGLVAALILGRLLEEDEARYAPPIDDAETDRRFDEIIWAEFAEDVP